MHNSSASHSSVHIVKPASLDVWACIAPCSARMMCGHVQHLAQHTYDVRVGMHSTLQHTWRLLSQAALTQLLRHII